MEKYSYKSYLILFVLLNFSLLSFSQKTSVLTRKYDNYRLGWNNNEALLNTLNVSSHSFGLLFSREVDGQIYAQPLIISDMIINNIKQDVVFVATVNNTVYAFNAEDPLNNPPLWMHNLTPSGSRVIRNNDIVDCAGRPYSDFTGNMGIVGTPVIDSATSTIYVVSRSVTISSNEFEQYLHALDINTGRERPGSPVKIHATYSGTARDHINGIITFDPLRQNQRSALLLHHNIVYICWASHCDWGPFHGWMIGYDATTLKQKYVYNTTPNGDDGGIWMSGDGPSVDEDGFIYLSTGNGSVGSVGNPNDPINRGESLIKLKATDNLSLVNFFTPSNYEHLDKYDLDFGVNGVLIIPKTHIALSGSKEGKMYVLNTNTLGKYTPGNDSVLQILYANRQIGELLNHIHGTPVYCDIGKEGEFIYVWAESDSLRQFCFVREKQWFDTLKTITGKTRLDSGMPGAVLTVSSDGQTPSTAIVWASYPTSGNANKQTRPGTIAAFDARNITKLLWSSSTNHNRDSLGSLAKFNPPVVANGRVYVPTFSNQLKVYGLLSISPGKQTKLIESKHLSASKITISYQKGDGSRRAIFICEGENLKDFNPQNYTSYYSNNVLGLGQEIEKGWFCVANGTLLEDSVTIKGLKADSPYSIRIFDYNGENGQEIYLNDSVIGNPKVLRTLKDLIVERLSDKDASVSVFPNPVIDHLHIQSDKAILHPELYDIWGRRMNVRKIGLNTLDISHLQNGIYFLVIDKLTFKIIKMNQ